MLRLWISCPVKFLLQSRFSKIKISRWNTSLCLFFCPVLSSEISNSCSILFPSLMRSCSLAFDSQSLFLLYYVISSFISWLWWPGSSVNLVHRSSWKFLYLINFWSLFCGGVSRVLSGASLTMPLWLINFLFVLC